MLDLYLDADACPVKEEAYRVARRFAMKVYVVSAVPIRVPEEAAIENVAVGRGFDAVDDWIEAHAQPGDIVVTNDVLLAARVIKRGAVVVDPRGKVLTEDNIGEAVATRELMYELRQAGAIDTGPKQMGKKYRSTFLSSLDAVIQRLRRAVK